VVVTGARQVGKSTMFKHAFPDLKQVSLDTPTVRRVATETPELFFGQFPPPIVVDEVQRATLLFEYIKERVDNEPEKHGQFFLTGSQSFNLMKDVTESLAGRAGIIKLTGLSLREILNLEYYSPFKPTQNHYKNLQTVAKRTAPPDYDKTFYIDTRTKELKCNRNLTPTIWNGSFPRLNTNDFLATNPSIWQNFYNSYIETYIERDVKQLTQVQDETAFIKFMRGVAALSGEQLNYSTLAEICDKDVTTTKRWLSILETSGLVYRLEPYFNNISKRMIKSPKIYFMDTGLACFLGGWNTPDQLLNGARWGSLFETYIVSEIIKSYYNAGLSKPPLYYYRDKDKVEIDLIIEEGGVLYPIEIKTTGNPSRSLVNNFEILKKVPTKTVGEGAVICQIDRPLPITETVIALPPWMI